MGLAWFFCILLAAAVVLLAVKVYLLQKSADEICREFTARLTGDTNNPIFISSRDRHVRRLASQINGQLRELRRERRRFQTGDLRLKEAVTNISHDLRTPLTAISGYLDLLEREPRTEQVMGYLDCIRSRTEALTELTQELFTYTLVTEPGKGAKAGPKGQKPAGPKRKELDLGRLLEESLITYYGAFAKRGIEPQISLPEEPVMVWGDEASFGRIFGNIISNGLKYSGGDFAVTLTEGGKVTFSNQAPGMTAVLAEQLFLRYYTVETGAQSTGLGLAIAKELTQGLGGEIRARYEEGRLVVAVEFPPIP